MADNDHASIGSRLRKERKTRVGSAADLAARFREIAPDHIRRDLPHLRDLERTIRGHESGEHAPGPRYRSLWSRALDIPLAELFSDQADAPADGSSSRGSVEIPELPIQIREDDMRRRAALQLLTAVAAGQAIPPGVLEDVLSGAAPDFDGRTDLDDWDRVVSEYSRLMRTRPVGSLIGDLTADIIAVGRLLERRHAPMVQAGLLRVSAGLSWMLAAQFDDIGDRRAARVTWQSTRRAADDSGDLDLRVWVRSKQASMVRWSDRPADLAAALTDEAVALSSGKPSKGLAQAYSVRSALAARRGDARASQNALNDLADVMDHVDWPGYHALSRAYPHSLLGDRSTNKTLDEVMSSFSTPESRADSHIHMVRALDLVRRREISEGLRLAVEETRSRPISAARRHIVGEIVASIPAKHQALPAVRELHTLAGAASN